jgi:hypothetical protein
MPMTVPPVPKSSGFPLERCEKSNESRAQGDGREDDS